MKSVNTNRLQLWSDTHCCSFIGSGSRLCLHETPVWSELAGFWRCMRKGEKANVGTALFAINWPGRVGLQADTTASTVSLIVISQILFGLLICYIRITSIINCLWNSALPKTTELRSAAFTQKTQWHFCHSLKIPSRHIKSNLLGIIICVWFGFSTKKLNYY